MVSSVGEDYEDVVFGRRYQNGRSGSLTTPGLLDEIGAFGPTVHLDGEEYLLFSVRFRAGNIGITHFVGSEADDIGHEPLVFGISSQFPWNRVAIEGTELTVVESTADGADEDTARVSLEAHREGASCPVQRRETMATGGHARRAALFQDRSETMGPRLRTERNTPRQAEYRLWARSVDRYFARWSVESVGDLNGRLPAPIRLGLVADELSLMSGRSSTTYGPHPSLVSW